MDFSKDKLKRTGILMGAAGLGVQYLSAAVVNSFELIKDYKFTEFWDKFNSDLAHPLASYGNFFNNPMFYECQPFLWGGTLALGCWFFFKQEPKYKDASNYGAYGSSRWATDSEIFNPEDITTNIKREGTILGIHKKKLVIHHAESGLNRNIGIVGGSGAGKTASHIVTNILKHQQKSMVVVDPKGELYEKTSEIKRKQGYEVHLVNFKNRDVSDRYNLFDYLRGDSDAFKVADTLVNNASEGHVKKDFWNQAQTSVLQALILYVKYALPPEQRHMGSVINLGQANEDIIRELFYEFPKTHVVRKAYQTAVEKLKDKTLSDVFITLMQTLNPWQYDDVCHFTSANDFLFEDLGKKKMIVYVIMPIADNEFSPLITTFFTQMFSELYRLADLTYGELPQRVILMLDEFANIGKIPNFEKRLSTTRSLGIEVTIILQDMSQLERVYGKELAKEIINNCDTRMLLKAAELQSAKYFSDLAGKTTIQVTNNSRSNSSKSSSKSESNNYVARSLITPDEITRLKKDEMLLFITGQFPIKIKKAWYFKMKEFKKLTKNGVSRDEYPMVERGQYDVFYAPSYKEIKAARVQEEIDFDDVQTFDDEELEAFKDIGKEAYDYEQEIAASHTADEDQQEYDELEDQSEADDQEDDEQKDDVKDKKDEDDDIFKNFTF